MLIGLCGGICAGKRTIAEYLVEQHGFTKLHLRRRAPHIVSAPYSGSDDFECYADITRPTSQVDDSSFEQTTFLTPEDLLDFVTKRWRERWVTVDIHSESVLDILAQRPFFILVSVDAPVSVRWKRYHTRLQSTQSTTVTSPSPVSLDEFLIKSDTHLYSPNLGLLPLISRATIRLINTSSNLAQLYTTLEKLDLTNDDQLRPSWDQYFMQLASLAAHRSNCMKRRVGCVLVREKRVISTGYNGTPRGFRNCAEGGCGRCNEGHGSGVGLGTCLCIHAEENALLEAGRERIREGAILYCDTCPCLTCSIKIAQVGIAEVVYSLSYSMDRETADIFKQAGVRLRQFTPPTNGLIHLEKSDWLC